MPQNPDIRWRQRFQSFAKALGQLSRAHKLAQQRPLSELERLGLMHIFEFTHELAMKTLNDFLQARGRASLYGVRDITREAAARGLIENGEAWMTMLDTRKQVTRGYHRSAANEIVNAITSSHVAELERFRRRGEYL